ncbi:MAG: hypothetical protein OXF33_06395 [Rhodospirillales bacterium]|nr:hypothetical protein [Rhodospirillales bacterium]MXX23115.1 hypothetical protein [Rhodospirillales bacterium]MYD97166.1 hypothetical protein [Gammaproteobacteria bacterium]
MSDHRQRRKASHRLRRAGFPVASGRFTEGFAAAGFHWANAALGAPYSEEMIANARAIAAAQADPEADGAEAVMVCSICTKAQAARWVRRWPEPPSARSAAAPS